VLLALTEKDLEKRDIYPFLALSRGLIGHKEARQYGITNFAKIAHPTIKLSWAVLLFTANEASSPEIVVFLRKALDSKEKARILSEMLGPGFEEFKEQVIRTAEAGKQTKVELVKQHSIEAFPDYRTAFSCTNKQCIFAPGRLLYAVRPPKKRGCFYLQNFGESKTRPLVIPQPEGFKAKYDFPSYFENPVLTVNPGGDLLCRWTIKGNGDHGLALLKKGSDSFLVKRISLYLGLHLGNSCVVAGPDGGWYLVNWRFGTDFTVYRVDKELNVTQLGNFKGKGHHSIDILDARFISKDVLHLFWGDVLFSDNYLRMRCVDFDVKKQKWVHAREIFRLDKFVSSANEPAVLQVKDESLHYVWKIDEGAAQTKATGLYYQAEADGKTVKFSDGYEYRAIAAGDRIVVCYTLKDSPEKVFFRVIQHGILGPVSEITAAKGRSHNLWSEDLLLYWEPDRIWFMNTLATNALYELRIVDAQKAMTRATARPVSQEGCQMVSDQFSR